MPLKITIISSPGFLTYGQTASVVFNSDTEMGRDLVNADIVCKGGKLSSLARTSGDSYLQWRATFTPDRESIVDGSIFIAAGAVNILSNGIGNLNDAVTLYIGVDTRKDRTAVEMASAASEKVSNKSRAKDDAAESLVLANSSRDELRASGTATVTDIADADKRSEAAANAYNTAASEYESAKAGWVYVKSLVKPTSRQGNDWDTPPGDGYVGLFHARGTLKTGSDSWAGLEEPELIKKSGKVDQLVIDKALALAKSFDADVDGVSSTGTSIVKEGNESFTFGASYSGVQGVNISEVSGLSASYVRGKRVGSLKGDAWAYQDGEWSIAQTFVDNFESYTDVKRERKTIAIAGKTTSDTQTKKINGSSGNDVTKKIAEGNIESLNFAHSTMTTTNLSGASTTVTVTGHLTTANLAASRASVSIYGVSVDVMVSSAIAGIEIGGYRIEKFVIAKENKSTHITNLSTMQYHGAHFSTGPQEVALHGSRTNANKQSVVIFKEGIKKNQKKYEENQLNLADKGFNHEEAVVNQNVNQIANRKEEIQEGDVDIKIDNVGLGSSNAEFQNIVGLINFSSGEIPNEFN